MDEFKLALCQHAIKHKFEFCTKHSSKHRPRAYCSRNIEDKCPWKIHASTTADGVTVMVTIIVTYFLFIFRDLMLFTNAICCSFVGEEEQI
jgi:hypothetical protein